MQHSHSHLGRQLALTAGLCLFAIGSVQAQTVGTQYVWTGTTSSEWTNAANWNVNGVAPTGASYNARLQVQNGAGQPLIYSADLGHTIYQATNISGQTPRALLVGNFARGAMTISGGIMETRGSSPDIIGNAAGISTLTIDGGEYLSTNSGARTMVVGFAQGGGGGATGVLQISSGMAAVNFIDLGFAASATGAAMVNLDGGTLAAERIRQVANTAAYAGEFNFNGGTLMALANRTDFLGGLTRANVGTNGAIVDTAGYSVTIGQSLLHDAALGATADGGLRKRGDGTLTLTNANTYDGLTVVERGFLRIEDAAGLGATSAGTVVSNDAALVVANSITVSGEAVTINGRADNFGALQAVGGSNTWEGQILLASGSGSSGTRIGTKSGGQLYISGQVTNAGGNFDLGIRTDDSPGSKVVFSNPNNVWRSTYAVVGTAQIEGGDDRLPAGTVLHLGNSVNTGTATVDLNGYNQRVGGLVSDGTTMAMTVTNTAGTTSRLTIDNSVALAYEGAIGGDMELLKIGNGAQTLSGIGTYTGATVISNGALLVNGMHLGGGAYTVAGGTLGGTGLIDAAVQVLAGGIVAPGNSIGALTTSNSFDLDGTLRIELENAAGPGAGLSDLLDVNGFFDITNGTVQFVYAGTLTNDFYVFAEYDSLSGDPFLNVLNLPGGYEIDYNFGVGGNQIALVIPEPSTMALLALGFALVAGIVRRRRR